MPFIVRKLENNGLEMGAEVLASFPKLLSNDEKVYLEGAMLRFVTDELYPKENLKIYTSVKLSVL